MGLICDMKQDKRYWDWEEVQVEPVEEVHTRKVEHVEPVRHSHVSHSPSYVPTPCYVPTSPKLYAPLPVHRPLVTTFTHPHPSMMMHNIHPY